MPIAGARVAPVRTVSPAAVLAHAFVRKPNPNFVKTNVTPFYSDIVIKMISGLGSMAK